MNDLYLPILGFIGCAGVIIFSGSKLAYYGDKITELTGWGKAWVGLILMALVTSLPELITGISSVAIIKAPNLAAGDVFGSCVFNLLILSLLDARLQRPILSSVKSSHIVAAIFGIILMTLAGLAIYLAENTPTILWISSFSVLLIIVYLIAVWGIFKYEQAAPVVSTPVLTIQSSTRSTDLKQAVTGYFLHAFIVIGAALFLPYFGQSIAEQTGLGNSFFGTVFIAATTSLPELVVSMSALRLGAIDMAVGNLLGSNVFNMLILGIDDFFYREGSLFQAITPTHILPVFVTIIMSAVVGLGLVFKPSKKQFWRFSLDTFIIILLYLALMAYLYVNR